MKTLMVLFMVLCVGSSGIDPDYNIVPSEFIDEGLPEMVQQVWRGQGVVRRHLFFLQIYAQQLFGPMSEQVAASIVIILLVSLFAGTLSMKASQSENWWYKDSEGVVRGPFSTLCMKNWRSTGYLPDDLEIKCAVNASFVPLRELFPAPAVPFQSPPTPPASQVKALPSEDQRKIFEEEACADMLRDQHDAFENRSQDLEEEMIKTLEADLEDSVLSHDIGKGLQSSFFKSYDEEELAELRAWRAQRKLHREELAQSQIQISRYNPEKTQTRRSSKGMQKSMERNSSEERILKQFNTRCINELTSEHEAQLEEGLVSLIESH